jgi:hypothetical protein
MTKLGQASATTKQTFLTGPSPDGVKYQRGSIKVWKSSVEGPEIMQAPAS